MKNSKYIRLLGLLGLFGIFSACQSKDLVFDHEKTQFEPMANAILIEFIAPVGTAVDDEIYIFGAFNGLDENSALGEIKWQMEKAPASDKKWGIYIFPSDFKEGKTLADGFSFVSKKAGGERDIKGNPVSHTLNASLGSVYNIWADRWETYFSGENKIIHNGPVIYVLDESGFGKLTLYLYGDVNDLNGGWPGMNVTGYETVNGMELAYFDIGEANEGLNESLIFSDNGANQLPDYGPVFLGSDPVYLHLTEKGTIEILKISAEHDGPVVYVLDGKEWGMNTTLYLWGDVNDLNGGWPGMSVGGTETFGEYTYLYFDLGEANIGLKESLILSNNGATQLGDFPGGEGNFWTIGDDLYLYMGADGVVQIADPENPGDVVWYNPTAAPKVEAVIDIYFHNAASADTLYFYAWGNAEVFGAWPGQSFVAMDTTSILGLELLHTRVNGFVGDQFHLIVNNNGPGEGKEGDWRILYDINAEEPENTYYLKIADDEVSELTVVAKSRRK